MAIIGGGPVGLAAALAAAIQGIASVVLDAREDDDASTDPRVFALSHGARLILERLGAWHAVAQAHPIRCVHVSQRGSIGQTTLAAADLGLTALGYVVAHADLMQALKGRAADMAVERLSGVRVEAFEERSADAVLTVEAAGATREIAARVVVQADGGPSRAARARAIERTYGQCALIAQVRASQARHDWAYERFTPAGPIALLPLGEEHALVWTVGESEAGQLLGLNEAQFERALADSYGERIGAVRLTGVRMTFPLRMRFAHRITGRRLVLIGNAAQTLHPVAGQGFNLGLRDAFELAHCLGACAREGRDMFEGLDRYRSRRRVDRAGGTFFTDFLVRAFSNDDPLLRAARGTGLVLLDALDPLKKFLMRRMIYGS